jgi:hypothetical protein
MLRRPPSIKKAYWRPYRYKNIIKLTFSTELGQQGE